MPLLGLLWRWESRKKILRVRASRHHRKCVFPTPQSDFGGCRSLFYRAKKRLVSSVCLRPSIRVPQAQALADGGQLQICAGTESADKVVQQDRYVAGARVPKGPWRTPVAEELSCLMEGAADAPPGETLEFLSLTA